MAGTRTYIRTFTGATIHPLEPDWRLIDIRDISHALSNIGRYTGHTKRFYSVAQHSVLVSFKAPSLWALLHDATEAYIADIAKPLKHQETFAMYRVAERRLMDAVCQKFYLGLDEPAAVKDADQRMLATEIRDLMPCNEPWPFEPYDDVCLVPRAAWIERAGFGRLWTPDRAEREFLKRFADFTA